MNEAEYIRQQVQAWFAKGDNDLKTAEIVIREENPPTDTICFHCQQTAEKHLKGFLVQHSVSFPKTHDLHYLLSLCLRVSEEFKEIEDELGALSSYAIETRYPADIPILYPLTEAKSAIAAAKVVADFVKGKSSQ